MDVTASGDETGAASPAASDDGSIVVDAAFDARFRDDYQGAQDADSPPADGEGDQDPSPEDAAEPEEKKADDEDDADEAESEEEVPAKTAKRMEKLLDDRAKLGEELRTLKQDFATREDKYRLALNEAVRQKQRLEQRLSEYVDLNAPEEQLEAVQGRQRLQAELQQRQQKLQEQFAREAEEAKQTMLTETYRETFSSALDDAAGEYPHLSRAAIKEGFLAYAKENPDYPVTEAHKAFREVAKQLDDKLSSAYEPRVLEKHKAKLRAPSPVSARGTVGSSRPLTDEEMAADLDARLGADHFRG